jgi:hypothetical protein
MKPEILFIIDQHIRINQKYDDGFDLFIPLEEVQPTENQRIKY